MKQCYFIMLSLILIGCQDDIEPSWLEINEVELTTNEAIEGVNTENISDAWVYLNSKDMGVWEIPFKMPILEEGNNSLLIIPGIKIAGVSERRTTYSFYTPYETEINLTKGEVIEVKPSFSYKSFINIVAKEDFEDTGTILNPKTDADSSRIKIISKVDNPDIVKYGNGCGKIVLTQDDSLTKVITEINLPIVRDETYIELDYLSTNSFTIGIISENVGGFQTDLGPYAGGKKTDPDNFEWKKLYFPIAQQTNTITSNVTFEFYILSVLDPDTKEGVVYIDNIKVVHL